MQANTPPARKHSRERASADRRNGQQRKRARAAEKARSAVHEYCLLNYGTSYIGGAPRQLRLAGKKLWIVPVLLTSPGYGELGEVGLAAVDMATGAVVGASHRTEVRTAASRLTRENRDALDAALHRARTR